MDVLDVNCVAVDIVEMYPIEPSPVTVEIKLSPLLPFVRRAAANHVPGYAFTVPLDVLPTYALKRRLSVEPFI